MINYLHLIQQHNLGPLMLEGNFGLEKENIRTSYSGALALTPHPQVFADKSTHPYITTDFAEAQLEMITPPLATPNEALAFMEGLHDLVAQELQDELLWPYSLPPILPQNETLIKAAQFSDPEITEYREYLATKYGKRKQLLSGVHFNVSFSAKFLQLLYKAAPSNSSFREFNDQVYLKIARYYLKYSWLPIYLFGANNVAHASYIDCCRCDKQQLTEDSYVFSGASSFRNGVSGYRNLEHFFVSYNSLYDYIDDIQDAIHNGYISAAKEYYSQLRLKGHSKANVLADLHHNGISYIEIRTLDLNPLSKVGITLESLEFIHLLLIYALIAPDFFMSDDEYRLANTNQILAADASQSYGIQLHYSTTTTRLLSEWGQAILADMRTLLGAIGIPKAKLEVIDVMEQKLVKPELSIAAIVATEIEKQGYTNYFLELAQQNLALSKRNYFKFSGFEDLELSTQVLLKEAIKHGVKFKFLDRQDNFLELENNGVRQLVKQATRTAVDNYVTILAMENKQVTKSILTTCNICVPKGEEYLTLNAALTDYHLYTAKPIVIKPNSTNFGVGVTIFKDKFSLAEYKRALEIAFSYDKQILVEEFITGREYRFFVIKDEAVAVLNREPANIVGDGKHSIRDLVTAKNHDPLRGTGYKTPLEIIRLEETEAMFLAQYGLSFDSIPADAEKIYLRENSNISTGGDSIDYTDKVPNSYKRIAVKAAKSVGAVICGVDMIIKNINNPYPENNYAILELNYNPAIHIHTYPYLGQDRKLAQRILKLLRLIAE